MNTGRPRSWMRLSLGLLLVSLLVLGTAQQASAGSIIYVKYSAGGLNNGTSWPNAYRSLQTALSHAVSGQQIWVAKGTYKPTTGTSRTASFILKNGVAVYGGFAGGETSLSQRKWQTNLTTLSGDIGSAGIATDNSFHVVNGGGSNSTAILDGFKIVGGNANGASPSLNWGGGGMLNSSSSPTLRNLILQGNAGSWGAGIMDTNGSSPTLNNVTFSGNLAGYEGGGMYNEKSSNPKLTKVIFSGNIATQDEAGGMDNYNSNPQLTNVTFTGNKSADAGGMANFASNPTLVSVNFSSNSSQGSGGGMSNFQSSKPVLTNVSFTGNSAITGGGMSNWGGSAPTLTRVTFGGNEATNDGGGMWNTGSSPILTNVSFAGNSATFGAGVENTNASSPKLTNVTFSANTATNSGGGVYNTGNSNPSLKNVTFVGNSAGGNGGGMYNNSSSPTIKNASFDGNSASSGNAMNNSSSNALIYDSIFWGDGSTEILNVSSTPTIADSVVAGGCPGGSTCSGNIFNADPKLGSLQNNGGFTKTMALGTGSAAIDAGNNSTCTAKDQRGVVRPQGLTCDIGAYEVKVMSFPSQGVNDGWLLESSENSSVGGSLNSTSSTVRVGDDGSNRQYRGLLSFNTAGLPDAATVVRGAIKVKRAALTGTDPFSTLGPLVLDVKKPYFGSVVGLEISDFQASATASSAGGIGPLMLSGWYWGLLSGSGDAGVNKTGTTQLRLRFSLDDNNNHAADYLSLYSGDATSSYRPRLMVYYNP